ncbi:DUF4339 domain-containing protein [Methylocystis parvus]|uniref:DUF4339 domain-containing protein n=1 Tax=Methylocystis parvus TaxID=134 RepID=A0A6B8M2W0_9HYPH|nr:DUF4339 domain-containing protein [Methylocystis parvus]QGM97231.1 DUF4339 domain-containing protein [Methylocystis parvus]WBJ98861.1 DUF4339 domain-containing protein [Methylocystis parvus OBBP]
MTEQWYCAENGESVGPLSTQQVAERLGKAAKGKPYLVWSPGMSQWSDARVLPQFAPRAPAAAAPPPQRKLSPERRHELVSRARHEFISYLAVSGYLMVWFSAVMFYKATILRSVGVEFAPLGFAVVKALILGKFILVLEAVKLGERRASNEILIWQIVKKALLFTVALIFLSLVEEVIMGHFHGKSARDVLSEIGGGSISQTVATGILMFLVLLPYFAFRRLALELGALPELLFTRRDLGKKQ